MKPKNIYYLILLLILFTFSCGSDEDFQVQIDELKVEIAKIKALLESNSDITAISIVDGQLVLTFSDGTSVNTPLPESPLPHVGNNGNWFIGDVDLGSKAVAEVPKVGSNGNWFVGDSDTGVKAQGTAGQNGSNGTNGASAYELWLEEGNEGSTTDFLNWLKGATGLNGAAGTNGANGASAYEIWLIAGNTGTVSDFLEWLKGTAGASGTNGIDGKSAYEVWSDAGNTGTELNFLNWLKGATGDTGAIGTAGQNGKSAYDLWIDSGNSGTQTDFLNWLKGAAGINGANGIDGKSAYDIWVDAGNFGTETDFLNWLKGANGATGTNGQNGKSAFELWLDAGNSGTETDFLNWLKGATGATGVKGDPGVGVSTVTYDQTSGILTIYLTDGQTFDFTVYYEASELKALKLSDLNGAYLLTGLYNGDMPFVKFEYDADNRLSKITYHATILNEPVPYMEITRTYNGNGDILQQTYTEKATKNKAVQDGDAMKYVEEGILMTYVDAYTEIFGSGLSGYSGDGDVFYGEFYGNITSNGHVYLYTSDGIYKHMILGAFNGNERFGVSDIGDGTVYIWTPKYILDDQDWEYSESNDAYVYSEVFAYDAVDFSYSTSIDPGSGYDISHYPWGQEAELVAGSVDDTSDPTKVFDYISTLDETYDTYAISGDYKTLFKTYNVYNQGDIIKTYNLNYVYSGSDFTVLDDDEESILDLDIKVINGRVTSVIVFNDDPEINAYEEVLKFSYNGSNKLSTITSPTASNIALVNFSYDGQGNPNLISVNPNALNDGDDPIDPAILEALGLIYSYDAYDVDLGMVVEKYHYPTGNVPLFKIGYDYTMKNFMNHNFQAANPLLQVFGLSNAIKDFNWAGHGSAVFSEYLEFNNGGYPTKIKTYLQASLGDIPLDEFEIDLDFDIPINVSVAITYKLEYKKKL